MKDVRIFGVDLGKNSCSIVGVDLVARCAVRPAGRARDAEPARTNPLHPARARDRSPAGPPQPARGAGGPVVGAGRTPGRHARSASARRHARSMARPRCVHLGAGPWGSRSAAADTCCTSLESAVPRGPAQPEAARGRHSGCQSGTAVAGQDGDAARRLATRPARSRSWQHRRSGAGEQAHPDRLGAPAQRDQVHRRRRSSGVERDRLAAITDVASRGGSADGGSEWPDSQPVSQQPTASNGTRCRPFIRTGTRGSPSWQGSNPETGYVAADCSDQSAEATSICPQNPSVSGAQFSSPCV
jgi:hypothetical protein